MLETRHGFFRAILTCGPIVIGLFSSLDRPASALEPFFPQYECRSLPEVLDDLVGRGLPVVYDGELVTTDMLVRENPPTKIPHQILEQVVGQHGLAVLTRADGRLEVVPGPEMSPETVAAIRASARDWQVLKRHDSLGVLPDWVSHSSAESLAELTFPGDVTPLRSLSPTTRFLIVRLGETEFADWSEAAFALKQTIVAAGAAAPGLRVGLEGKPEAIERLIGEELAPYVDGYVYESVPFIPTGDPTGRPWWRVVVGERQVLATLLEGDRQRAELVIFGRTGLDERHAALLREIQRLQIAYLDDQPGVLGIDQERVRFFFAPETSHYFLAVYAEPGQPQDIRFGLEPGTEVSVLFPPEAEFAWDSYGSRVEVLLDGTEPYYLFELAPGRTESRRSRLLIEDEVIVDPYEVVVRNQMFQRREREKFRSLDVMEYITETPHWIGGNQALWEHRIIERKGRLSDYHHLNAWINGVHRPHNKMYKGPLNRPAARVELEPLDVELDKTYEYSYQGQDEIDGHPTWKIGFKPIASGRFLSGVIWIDQRTGAHRRIKTSHKSFGGTTLSRSYTTDYEWIPDNGNCYWNWRVRRGVSVYDYLTFQGTSEFEERRENFRFNRTDIEEEVRRAYASDIMIHVETPPQGHRWLVRTEDGRRVQGEALYPALGLPEASPLQTEVSAMDGTPSLQPLVTGPTTRSEGASLPEQVTQQVPLTSDRILAGLYDFARSSRISFGVSHNSNADEPHKFIGVSFSDLAFAGREWYFSIGAFDEEGLIAFTNPSLFDSKWSFTTALDFRTNPEEDYAFREIEDETGTPTVQDVSIDTQRVTLGVSLTYPISGSWIGRVGYGLNKLEFDDRPATDLAFVLPIDTTEHLLRSELNYLLRNLQFELRLDYGYREDWEPWGIDGGEEVFQDYMRGLARVTLAKSLTRSQMIGARLAIIDGVDTDRFSRYRLFQVDARVPGYNSSAGLDQGTAAELFYNFRIWKLPFRYRLDGADYSVDHDPVMERVVGHQLNLFLHGPLKTDWSFGFGRGLYSDPDRGPQVTVGWIVVSRRFGG